MKTQNEKLQDIGSEFSIEIEENYWDRYVVNYTQTPADVPVALTEGASDYRIADDPHNPNRQLILIRY